jgi:hypothetical protein
LYNFIWEQFKLNYLKAGPYRQLLLPSGSSEASSV